MTVTAIVNFAKPAYEQFVGKFNVTINTALSFALGVCWAFAVSPYLELELSTWALILIWLALWTWATIFYDLLKLVQNAGSRKDDVEEKSSAIWFTTNDEDGSNL